MNTDPLTILEAVEKGPCAEFDSHPFWRLRTAKDKGWIEPYRAEHVPHHGASTHWTLSPEGRAELKRLKVQRRTQP